MNRKSAAFALRVANVMCWLKERFFRFGIVSEEVGLGVIHVFREVIDMHCKKRATGDWEWLGERTGDVYTLPSVCQVRVKKILLVKAKIA